MTDPISCNSRRRRSPLATGLVLIVIGGLLLAMNLGWDVPLALRNYWPLLLIIPGLVGIAVPTRHLTRSGGIWLVTWGCYCLISVTEWMGLGWFSAWPVFVIAFGLDMIIGEGFKRHADESGKPGAV